MNTVFPKSSLSSFLSIAVLLFWFFPGTVFAGCRINYSFENSSDAEKTATEFQVKSKGGVWKDITHVYAGQMSWGPIYIEETRSTLIVPPESTKTSVYEATFGCSAHRRYRYTVGGTKRDGSSCRKTIYFPSPTTWSTETDIDFGDISLHCPSSQPATVSAQPVPQTVNVVDTGTGNGLPGTAGEPPGAQLATQSDGGLIAPGARAQASALPGSQSGSAINQVPASVGGSSVATATDASNQGQCMVTSTQRFPAIRLRCGVSPADSVAYVAEEFLADCPLVAGDMVNVQVVEGQRTLQIIGRASGGAWCKKVFQPGYYIGPCLAEKANDQNTSIRTIFYQGRNKVASVVPTRCEPVRLSPGLYRVISEYADFGGGERNIALRETGLRLEGQEMLGDITDLLSPPIEQK